MANWFAKVHNEIHKMAVDQVLPALANPQHQHDVAVVAQNVAKGAATVSIVSTTVATVFPVVGALAAPAAAVTAIATTVKQVLKPE